MKKSERAGQVIEAALTRLPEWQPPAEFVARVAAMPGADRLDWVPVLLKGLRIAACVSVASWLAAELLYTGLLSMAEPERPSVAAWILGGGALLFAWRFVPPIWSRA